VDETYAKLVLSIIEKNEKPNDIPIDVSKITIEHIMPKKLNSSWEKDLGNDAVSIHEKFLKSIGNQVPLSKKWNSSLSNKVFIEKRRKYIEQQFSITREISDFEKWGEEELIKRNKDISERACNYIISPLKRSRDYDDDEVITFEDKIEDTKNKKIRAILYNDKEYIIKNWKDLIYKISEILYENIKNKFKTVSAQKKLLIVSVNDKEKLKNAKQIKNSEFYCETEIKLAKDSFKYAGIVAKHFNQEDKFKIIVGNEDDK
uniref:HNH endonuclease family protein n=1 Tax=Leptotrichia wadei TaxID=157687 RepID=UPI0028EFFF56